MSGIQNKFICFVFRTDTPTRLLNRMPKHECWLQIVTSVLCDFFLINRNREIEVNKAENSVGLSKIYLQISKMMLFMMSNASF